MRAIGAAVGIGADGLERRGARRARNSSIFSPAAGLPEAVSSTCVVRRPMSLRSSAVPIRSGSGGRLLPQTLTCSARSQKQNKGHGPCANCAAFRASRQIVLRDRQEGLDGGPARRAPLRATRRSRSTGRRLSESGTKTSVPAASSCSMPITVWKAMQLPRRASEAMRRSELHSKAGRSLRAAGMAVEDRPQAEAGRRPGQRMMRRSRRATASSPWPADGRAP